MSSYTNDPYRPVGQPAPVNPPAQPSVDASLDASPGTRRDVADTAVDAGKDVLETAQAEVGHVVDEAKVQGRRLLDESVTELRSQASTVQERLADTIQALSDELRDMTTSSDAHGTMATLAESGQHYGDRAAAWLRDNDLDQALGGVRRYAARNPWTFLAIAGGAGLLVGRLARSLRDAEAAPTASDRSLYATPRPATDPSLDPVRREGDLTVGRDPEWGTP